jgi:hypothetical protein
MDITYTLFVILMRNMSFMTVTGKHRYQEGLPDWEGKRFGSPNYSKLIVDSGIVVHNFRL